MTQVESERVAVCVAATRPDGLRRLFDSLDAQDLGPHQVQVFVADNTAAGVIAADPPSSRRFAVHVAHEPVASISRARNRSVADALPWADVIAFIDDDETAPPSWVRATLAVLRSAGADIASGPVMRGNAPEAGREEGRVLRRVATNNTVVDASLFRRTDRWFDERLGLTGGEDKEFFVRVLAAGARAVGSGVPVLAPVGPARAGLAYRLRRAYAIGNVDGLLVRWEGGRGLAAALPAAIVAIGIALLVAPWSPLRARWVHRRMGIAARRVGWIVGRAGVAFHLYGSGHHRSPDEPEPPVQRPGQPTP